MAALNMNAPPEMYSNPGKEPKAQKKPTKEQNEAVIQALHMGKSPGFDKSMALDGQSAMLPIEQKGNITNFFNKEGVEIQTQNETFDQGNPDMGKSNKSIHLGMQESM